MTPPRPSRLSIRASARAMASSSATCAASAFASASRRSSRFRSLSFAAALSCSPFVASESRDAASSTLVFSSSITLSRRFALASSSSCASTALVASATGEDRLNSPGDIPGPGCGAPKTIGGVGAPNVNANDGAANDDDDDDDAAAAGAPNATGGGASAAPPPNDNAAGAGGSSFASASAPAPRAGQPRALRRRVRGVDEHPRRAAVPPVLRRGERRRDRARPATRLHPRRGRAARDGIRIRIDAGADPDATARRLRRRVDRGGRRRSRVIRGGRGRRERAGAGRDLRRALARDGVRRRAGTAGEVLLVRPAEPSAVGGTLLSLRTTARRGEGGTTTTVRDDDDEEAIQTTKRRCFSLARDPRRAPFGTRERRARTVGDGSSPADGDAPAAPASRGVFQSKPWDIPWRRGEPTGPPPAEEDEVGTLQRAADISQTRTNANGFHDTVVIAGVARVAPVVMAPTIPERAGVAEPFDMSYAADFVAAAPGVPLGRVSAVTARRARAKIREQMKEDARRRRARAAARPIDALLHPNKLGKPLPKCDFEETLVDGKVRRRRTRRDETTTTTTTTTTRLRCRRR